MELSEFVRKDNEYEDKFFSYWKENDYDSAIEVIKEQMEFHKNHNGEIPKILEQRLEAINNSRYSKIIKANNTLGLELEDNGEIDEAIKVFEENLELNCNFSLPYLALIRLYRIKYDFENEKRVCELALQNVQEETYYSYYEETLEKVERILNSDEWKSGRLSSKSELISPILKGIGYKKYVAIIKDNNTLGWELEKKGEVDNAIKIYEENLKLNCTVSHPYVSLINLYHSKYDFENEKRVCELALQNVEKDPSQFESTLENVEHFLETGEWLFDYLPYDPKSLVDDIKKAKKLIKSESKDVGVEMLESIMENGTFSNTVYNTLYQTYKKDENYDDAIRVCEKAIDVLGFFSNERKVIWKQNLNKVTRDVIIEIIRKNNVLGSELERKGEIDEAINVYEENLELNCNVSHPYVSLINLYHGIYDFENEKRVCELALQNVNENNYYFLETLENVNQFLNTGEWMFDCLPLDSKKLDVDIEEAKAFLKNESKEKGIEMLEDIMANGTFNDSVYNTLYLTYKKDSRYDDAIRVCEKAIDVLGFFSDFMMEIWMQNLENVIKYKEKKKK